MDLAEESAKIHREGPSRVLIDAEGLAVSSERARRDYGVKPDVIFIRNDGWSLGAPASLEVAASQLWPDAWVGIMRRPNATAVPWPEK